MVNATSVSLMSASDKLAGVPSGAALLTTQNAETGGDTDTLTTVHGVSMLPAFVIVYLLAPSCFAGLRRTALGCIGSCRV